MATEQACKICLSPATLNSGELDYIVCPRCGNYKMTSHPVKNILLKDLHLVKNILLNDLSERQRANISGWLRDNQEVNVSSIVDDLINLRSPGFIERADRLLRRIGKESEFVGHHIKIKVDWISYAWCIHDDELRTLLGFLKELDRIDIYGQV